MPKRKAEDNPTSTAPKQRGKKLVQTALTGVHLGNKNDAPVKTVKLTGNLEETLKTNKIAPKCIDKTVNYVPGTLSDIRSFFTFAKKINERNPLEAFSELKGAKLCGYFERLNNENFHGDESEILLHCRYSTDLPEMMTFCTYENGRYSIWRDDPQQNDVLIVHVPNEEHFPFIEVVGDRIEHMLCHLGEKHENIEDFLPLNSNVKELQKNMQDVIKTRKIKKLGNLPNDVGIWVPERNGIGYREIGENAAELKKTLITIGSSDNYNVRKKAEEKLTELCAYVTMANDECDFGMGLELGHWLWLANYPRLNKKAKQLLVCAYSLLDRDDYSAIVQCHFEKREADAQKRMEENFQIAAQTLQQNLST